MSRLHGINIHFQINHNFRGRDHMTAKHNTKKCFRIVSSILIAVFLLIAWQNANAEPKRYRLGDIPLSKEAYEKHLKKLPLDMATIETTLPPAYDARDHGIVTEPKNQSNCGSCWAFACVGALESRLLQAGFELSDPDLSEQQQVSCNTQMLGCDGGNSNALLYWGASNDKALLMNSIFPIQLMMEQLVSKKRNLGTG